MMISNQYNQIQTSYVPSAGMQAQQYQTSQINNGQHADKVTFSSQYEQMKQAEQDIANRYDVTNMSEVEQVKLANELKANGLIDDKQFLMMSLEKRKGMAVHLGIEYTGDQKRDVLQDAKNDLEFTLQTGGDTTEGIAIREDFIALLEKLKTMKNTA